MPKLVHGLWFIVNSFRKKSDIPQTKRGFTLIEILVVLSIMAVLAGMLLFSTENARQKGKDSRRKQDLGTINSALISYYADHRQFPPTNPTTNFQRDYSSSSSSNWLPELSTYLNKTPKDPLQSYVPKSNFIAKNVGNIMGKVANYFTVSASSTGYLGNNNPTPASTTDGFSCIVGSKFTMPADAGNASGTTISAYIGGTIYTTGPNNQFNLAIYNDSGGRPSTQVANVTGTVITAGAGWRSVTLNPAVSLSNGTTYWLTYINNSGNGSRNQVGVDNSASAYGIYDCGTTMTNLPTGPGAWGAPDPNLKYAIYVTYTYSPITVPVATDIGGPNPTGYSVYRGDCDTNTNAYCLRVSNNLKAFVLWTTLENNNDPELYTNSSAKCNLSDTTWADSTSPYNKLNKKSDGTDLNFNYCIKSPQ